MISPAAFGGNPLCARVLAAHFPRIDLHVTGADALERLLLGAHDRLERRVARLVDRVPHRDHRRQLDLHGVVAVLGLTLATQPLSVDVHLDHLGKGRHAQVLGHHGADRVALAVVRLLAQEHEIGALAPQRLRQRIPGRGHVRAGQRRIGEVHRAVGPQRHRLVQRPHGALGAHRHGDNLLNRGDAPLLDLHRRLDGVRVVRVQVLLPAAVHAPRRGVDPLLDGGVGNLLHQHAYLHSANSLGFLCSSILLAPAVD